VGGREGCDIGFLNVVGLASRMDPEMCRRLQVVPQPVNQLRFTTIGMSPKLPRAQREHVIQLVAERLRWTVAPPSNLRLETECLKLILPSQEHGVSFRPLNLHLFSGALLLLVIFSGVVVLVVHQVHSSPFTKFMCIQC